LYYSAIFRDLWLSFKVRRQIRRSMDEIARGNDPVS
jgi:hypothetical protein